MNMRKIRWGVTLFGGLTICMASGAQDANRSQYPELGKVIPEFELSNVRYYPQRRISNKDITGKWVVLDFFSKNCSSCFASFPKINELQAKFKGKLEIILIGDTRMADGIEVVYEKFKNKLQLNLPVTYESKLFDNWGIEYVPCLIWINSKGIVKAVTASSDFTAENIALFLGDKDFDFLDRSITGIDSIMNSYTNSKPLLIDCNGGNPTDFLHRSLLSVFKLTVKQYVPFRIDGFIDSELGKGTGRFDVTGAILEWLYEYAYCGEGIDIGNKYGTFYHLPVLKLADPSLFKYDFQSGENLFNYSLIVPPEKATRKYLMEVMQRDLKNYFGYDAGIENPKVPYWSLKVSSAAKEKLKSKSEKEVVDGSHAGYSLKNVSIQRIIQLISGYHQQVPPFIDETGIDFKVDVEIDAMMTDLEDIVKALAKQGLILEKGEKEMPAIVIRDPKK